MRSVGINQGRWTMTDDAINQEIDILNEIIALLSGMRLTVDEFIRPLTARRSALIDFRIERRNSRVKVVGEIGHTIVVNKIYGPNFIT